MSGVSVAFITLGCAKNEVDTEHMRARLVNAGYTLSDDPTCADAVIVNTCSFIQAATEESIEAIFDAAALPNIESGHSKLVVSGCMPARYGEDVRTELTEAAAFVPCSKEDDIVGVLDELFSNCEFNNRERSRDNADTDAFCLRAPSCSSAPFAYVKISEGCDRFCSYCAIPAIRGRYHSYPLSDIEREVDGCIATGAREIILIAQDTGRWGADFDAPLSLSFLLTRLAERHEDTWFRVMYIQPEGISDSLLRAIAEHHNICSYLDIPLQHVNETLLRAMNRNGSRSYFEALISHIREVIPDVTLRTTLIAGFPGESDAQFEELSDFVAEGLFDYVGVFEYSREEGTRAYDFAEQIDEEEKAQRARYLRDVADAVCVPRIATRAGTFMDVLIEGRESDGQLYGRAMCQAPDVDGVTYVETGEIGQIVRVRITDTLMYEMEA